MRFNTCVFRSIVLTTTPGLLVVLNAGAASASTNAYSSVEVLATPNAQCALSGDGMGKPIKVWADDLGVVSFAAIHASPNGSIRTLSLDCSDGNGNRKTYSVDLTSDATFNPLPPQPIPSWVHIRPALVGDPMQYSRGDLIKRGYGPRPDPLQAPNQYAQWLEQASREMREVSTVHVIGNPPARQLPSTLTRGSRGNLTSPIWSGGLLCNAGSGITGCSSSTGQYTLAQGTLKVPGLASTTSGCASASLWMGIGGYNHSDLIQAGVEEYSQGSAESLSTWYEYVSGSSNTLIGLFNVSKGDAVYVNVYACNSSGDEVVNGNYGCFSIDDTTNSQYVNCLTPAGKKDTQSSNAFDCTTYPCDSLEQAGACHSIPASATFYGITAEAIIENNAPSNYCNSPQGTFANWSAANITLDADLNAVGGHNYSTDSNFTLTLTNGSGVPEAYAVDDSPSPNGTSFVWPIVAWFAASSTLW